jgi:hypothetical protein
MWAPEGDIGGSAGGHCEVWRWQMKEQDEWKAMIGDVGEKSKYE